METLNNNSEEVNHNEIENEESPSGFIPKKSISFYLALIFFFFSFCDFKCGAVKLATFTGYDFVLGTEIEVPNTDNMFSFENDSMENEETSKKKRIPPNIWAVISIIAIIIAIFGSYSISKTPIWAGIASALALIILQFDLKRRISEQKINILELEFLLPYWGVIILLLVGSYVCYAEGLRKKGSINH
jgi:hypothetical protein